MADKVTTTDREIEMQEPREACDVARLIPQLPKLDQIIDRICEDARQDSMRFAIRSDVGHDGE